MRQDDVSSVKDRANRLLNQIEALLGAAQVDEPAMNGAALPPEAEAAPVPVKAVGASPPARNTPCRPIYVERRHCQFA